LENYKEFIGEGSFFGWQPAGFLLPAFHCHLYVNYKKMGADPNNDISG
jgi:hypothetical protein